MKKFAYFVALILFISACSPANTAVSPIETSTATIIPTATNTSTPLPTSTLTPTITPSPTLSLPVSYQTPIPASNSKINIENVKNLQEIARYYGQMYFTAALSGDHKLLFVRDPVGIDIYDYQTSKLLNHVDLLGSTRNGSLQVNTNGDWVLVDDIWLIHFTPEKEPEIQNLNSLAVIPPKKGNCCRQVSLSPDGSKFIISELHCNSDSCVDDRFQLIRVSDMQIIYSWGGNYNEMHGQDPMFSQDGLLIITRVENQIIIWRISDGTQVAVIKGIQGNSWAVFSQDSSLVAIGQLDTVQIWDLSSGEKIQTIKGLCGDLNDPPQPIFLDSKRVVTLECPYQQDTHDRQVGTVSVWKVSDSTAVYKNSYGPITPSQIIFEEGKDQVNFLKNPRKVGPWIFPRTPYTFQFLNNGDLVFTQRDDQLRNEACSIGPDGIANCWENVILGTDKQFYAYTWQDDGIQFYKGFSTSGNSTYFVHWKGYFVNALDPINGFLFDTAPSSGRNNTSNSVAIGLENNRTIAEWHGSEIEKVAFSDDKTFAAVCTRPGGVLVFDAIDRDKLTLIDLSKKTIVYQHPFTCLNMPTLVLTKHGNKLITADAYIGKYGYTRHKLLIMNTTPPIQQKITDIGCDNLDSLTLSPDESMLVVACTDGTLRFLNPVTVSEIYRLTNIDPDIWGLTFSKDGTKLAVASKRGYISIWAIPPFSP